MKRVVLLAMFVIMVFTACSAVETGVGIEEGLTATGSVPPQTHASEEPAPTALKTTEPVPTPVPTLVLEPISINVVAAGDLMCLYAQLTAAKKKGNYEFDYAFAEIKQRVSAADLAIANLETLVAQGYKFTGPSPVKGSPKLNAPESYLKAALNCGFDAFVNANNHIFDRKTDGLDKTIQKLDEYKVYHTGAYSTGQQREHLIIDVKGISVAVLGYTNFINGNPKEAVMADWYSEELVSADIKAVRKAGADFIIVYMHWGMENTHNITNNQIKHAAFIANAGADIIIGSHPHCLQRTENIETERGDVPVFYSLGNLVSSMGRKINKDSALVNITLVKDPATGKTAIANLTYTPTYCMTTDAGRFVVRPADLESIEKAGSKSLESSRGRALKIMGDTVAQPQ